MPELLNGLEYREYYEPFVGGGSVFFALHPDSAHLSDSNQELIDAYVGLRDNAEAVISLIQKWEVSKEQYYAVRSMHPEDLFAKAARFIYLNRTSYNGIYRVNRSGEYNVPYGHNDAYQFDFQRLRKASEALQGVELKCADYLDALKGAGKGDLVFLDPPYTVSHNNNGFIEYNKKLFSLDDQRALKNAIDEIIEKKAFFILTNAAHETIAKLFEGSGRRLELCRHSLLGGKNAKRQQISEYVFTNVPNGGSNGVD